MHWPAAQLWLRTQAQLCIVTTRMPGIAAPGPLKVSSLAGELLEVADMLNCMAKSWHVGTCNLCPHMAHQAVRLQAH